VATGAGTSIGTWTNATSVVCHVYRSSTGSVFPGNSASTSGTTTTITYPALTLNNTSGTSWVAGFAGISSTASLQTAPSLMTNRATVQDATDEAAGHDTGGTVTSWSSTDVSAGGTNGNWVSLVVEIAESPIKYISSETGTNTLSAMPTHQTGDLLLFFAFRDGSTTAPSLPANYTSALTDTDDFQICSCRVGWKIATSASESIPTWTNATSVICHVYRGTHQTAPIGGWQGYSSGEAGGTNTVNYRTITMSDNSGASWVAGFAGHRSNTTGLETAPTGMINRSNVQDSTDEAAGHDTNGGVTSWSTHL
jgi:hypothetical protein